MPDDLASALDEIARHPAMSPMRPAASLMTFAGGAMIGTGVVLAAHGVLPGAGAAWGLAVVLLIPFLRREHARQVIRRRIAAMRKELRNG